MFKFLKINLILLGVSTLIFSGLFYMPSLSLAQIVTCTETTAIGAGNVAYCQTGYEVRQSGWCTFYFEGADRIVKNSYAVGNLGWACPAIGNATVQSQVVAHVYCCHSVATVSTAPTNVTAVGGDAQATISFSAPSSTGGSAITGYTVTSSVVEGMTKTGSGTASPITVTGLTNGAFYTFTVRAINSTGTGPASPPSDQVVVKGVPRTPTNVTATAGNQQIVLNWTAPDNGGVGISNYEIYKSTTSESFTSSPIEIGSGTGTGSASYTDTNVLNGITYYYKVAAKNSVGIGAQSVQVSAVLQIAATDSSYRHVEFGRVSLYGVGPTKPKARFICSPFAIKTVYGPSFTDKFTTPDYINWQGKHTTEIEAITATINSLEACLTQNNYNQFYSSGNGSGYYWPGPSCLYNKNTISKAWANGSITQSSNDTSYIYNGIARQVDYSNLEVYLNNIGYTDCQKGILPTTIHLRTTSCNNAINSIDSCSKLEATVPTSQGPYGIDLRVNDSNGPVSVDPGPNVSVNLTWSVTPEIAITNCVASGDWSGNKNLGSAESVYVTPADVPASDYYQGVVFGTPGSRSADCTPGTEGCSSKPHFNCSPWVNDSGIFIDKPSSDTHINYQGNYATQDLAVAASNNSLLTCFGTKSNYISLTKPVFDSGAYRGVVNPNDAYGCTLGGYWSDFASHWLYNGSLTGTWSFNECHYTGVLELFKIITKSPLTNKKIVSMSSYDCTPDKYGYKPSIGGCSSIVEQQIPLFKIATTPAIIYNNAVSSKTYTLTCDYAGGKLSDTAVVTINDLSAPGAPQNLKVVSGVDNGNLPGNTVSWNAPRSTGSAIIGYEIVKYGSTSCISKTDSEVVQDIAAGNANVLSLGSSLEFKDSFVTSGNRYTYAVRTENQLGGKGPFAVSNCSEITPPKQQPFTLMGSGFKDTMSVSIVNDTTNDVLKCDSSSKTITLNGTKLEINCEITDFTPVGKWNIVVQDGAQIYSSPADVFLSIVPKDNTLPPANISFSAQNPSVNNGVISIDSITGKNISESATVELVSGSDPTKRIPCITPLSQITGYASDGSVTLTGTDGIKCPTNNLTFDMGGVSDWKVVVKNSLATNGLVSDLVSAPTTSLACVSDCGTGKVCGLDQCGRLCTENNETGIVAKNSDGKITSITKSCAYAYGTCSITSTKTCLLSSGIYSACRTIDPGVVINSYAPALNTFCGSKSVITNCGTPESKTGTLTCASPNICGGGGTANTCGCTASSYTPALNTFCDSKLVGTNCNTTESKTGTLYLAPGQVCFNGSSCTPLTQAQARANKCEKGSPSGSWECGFVSDGCGGKYSCTAKSDGDCSSDGYNCEGHTCKLYGGNSPATD